MKARKLNLYCDETKQSYLVQRSLRCGDNFTQRTTRVFKGFSIHDGEIDGDLTEFSVLVTSLGCKYDRYEIKAPTVGMAFTVFRLIRYFRNDKLVQILNKMYDLITNHDISGPSALVISHLCYRNELSQMSYNRNMDVFQSINTQLLWVPFGTIEEMIKHQRNIYINGTEYYKTTRQLVGYKGHIYEKNYINDKKQNFLITPAAFKLRVKRVEKLIKENNYKGLEVYLLNITKSFQKIS